MKRDALRLARQILKRSGIDGSSFKAALNAVLVQADRLKAWKPLLEEAYARLSKRDQRTARSPMLAFYSSIRDWESAYRMLPARHTTALELLFSMETLLNLRKVNAAKSVQRKCQRMLRQRIDTFSASALLDALASYHAQIGELGAAEEYWGELSTLDEPLARGGMAGLVEIAAVRGMFFVAAGLLQLAEFEKKGFDDLAIILPHNRRARFAQAERQLLRYQKALEKIVPPSELRRYGIDTEPA